MMTKLETEQRIQEIQDSVDVLAEQLILVTRTTNMLAGKVERAFEFIETLSRQVSVILDIVERKA